MQKDKLEILIVDDNEFYRKGLILMLNRITQLGQVQEASNGIEFLEQINKSKPDIIFMDIKMPEMNGIVATKQAIQDNNQLKIIALTLHTDEVNFNEMILAGCKGFLLKTDDEKEFKRAIEQIINGGSYFSEKAMNDKY